MTVTVPLPSSRLLWQSAIATHCRQQPLEGTWHSIDGDGEPGHPLRHLGRPV